MKEVRNLNRMSKKFKISKTNTKAKTIRLQDEKFPPLILTPLILIFKKNTKLIVTKMSIVRSIIKIKPLLTGVMIKAMYFRLGSVSYSTKILMKK